LTFIETQLSSFGSNWLISQLHYISDILQILLISYIHGDHDVMIMVTDGNS